MPTALLSAHECLTARRLIQKVARHSDPSDEQLLKAIDLCGILCDTYREHIYQRAVSQSKPSPYLRRVVSQIEVTWEHLWHQYYGNY